MLDKKCVEQIRYLVVDVDGTMTDAGIYYDEHGNELKKFCTKDAAGFFRGPLCGNEAYGINGQRMPSHHSQDERDEI